MFDISWNELLVIAAVALVVIGPKDLPRVLRSLTQWIRKARELAADFQRNVDEMMREAELHDLKNQIEKATSGVVEDVKQSVDPGGEMQKAFEAPPAFNEPPSILSPPVSDLPSAADLPTEAAASEPFPLASPLTPVETAPIETAPVETMAVEPAPAETMPATAEPAPPAETPGVSVPTTKPQAPIREPAPPAKAAS